MNGEENILVPRNNQWKVVQGLYQATHLSRNVLKHLIKNIFDGGNLTATIKLSADSILSVHK